ncbi:pimeloyl-ACP methyl esterase BioG family protein [Maritalea sp.]|jgi:biotin synthesis protein BioG|uniref:pimeloyl-ACP methyl esterase BioG family protein n=1 Tax=Maritalea sp. TaxID=2003361 RepID=UPI0039E24166
MQIEWVKQDHNKDVIVVFGGWAVGFAPLAHLEGDFDILFVSDFRDIAADLPDLSRYEKKLLVAFSFGVAAYARWQADHIDPFTLKIAINGTVTPVDRQFGIPPIIMQKTIDALDPESLQAFLMRCFGERQPFLEADIDALKDELIIVQQRGSAAPMQFDKIIVSDKDRIFLSANLKRAYEGENVATVQGPHIPFASWTRWEEILNVA